MQYAVIMAGGAGVRLWPLSRRTRPKQVLKLFGGKSLVRQSYERVCTVVDRALIFIVANDAHVPAIAAELPELSPDNLIGEPAVRDTANAIGLSAAILLRRDPNAVMGVFTADHVISPNDRFRSAVENAYLAAEQYPDALVTMGIKPTRPETNYGYVRRGPQVRDQVFTVTNFIEKPPPQEAEKYLASGEYYWNSGMFVWRASTILDQLKKQLPDSHAALCEIADAWNTDARRGRLGDLYPKLPKISIDFAVMERADRVLVVEMDCRWMDIGSWPAVESVVNADPDGNVSVCSDVIYLRSRGCTAVSEERHLIAALGVEDLVVVHSPDATLICRKSDTAALKELVDVVRARYGDRYV